MNLFLAFSSILVAAVVAPSLDRIEEAAKRHDFEWFGLTVEDARKKAADNDLPFRVVKADGKSRPNTKDYRPGRINSHVVGDTIVAVAIEGQGHSIVEGVIDLNHLSLLGLTVEDATAHANLNGLPFRVVTRDGKSNPVTMDYIKKRANAVVVDGRVVAITNG